MDNGFITIELIIPYERCSIYLFFMFLLDLFRFTGINRQEPEDEV